ncbi:peroxisomal membrane protein PEX14 [Amyelois transitella]|uniref:peroxisomal membrane protein PEX14 n=1 Tax=Amyelois transitella TaxID=680683 RepID=UPI00067D9AD8|nr:peroxisomal membrane protein PEX14 [Amyelois transitella]
MSAELITNAGAEIRDNLVTTAVKFLTNPNVQRCTLESKERFLRSKGLTDLEIQKAIEKCGEMMDLPSLTSELMFFHHSRRSWFRDNILPLIVYGGFAYGCYWFYKNCIRHLLFVEEPKRKSTAECIDELRKSLDILNSNVSSLRGEMQTSVQQNALRSQLDNIKSDIASVKGILLNRNQFPTIKTRSEPPSIPSWQQQSQEATSTEAAGDDKKKSHRSRSQRSESGGSNSSEGEQATKNSDSSLEIMSMPSTDKMREKPKKPLSAYRMWLNSYRDTLFANFPKLSVTERAKKGHEIWKNLPPSEKSAWEHRAATARKEYEVFYDDL